MLETYDQATSKYALKTSNALYDGNILSLKMISKPHESLFEPCGYVYEYAKVTLLKPLKVIAVIP